MSNRGLERQSHGIYLSKDASPDEFALLQTSFPKATYSHGTALFLHGVSEREPIPLSASVESGYNSPSLKNRGVRVYYVRPEWRGMGSCGVKTPNGNLARPYGKEREPSAT